MASAPEPLPAELDMAIRDVGNRLGRLGSSFTYLSTTPSTNDVALQLAASGDREGAVVIAETQTAGRGRRGRSWFSPAGAGLYVSVVLTPSRAKIDPDRAIALTTLAAGVALAEGIERVTGLGPCIKWPNDLLVGRRKLAGILAEAITGSHGAAALSSVVLGYGLNVRDGAYPPELSDRVTSLESELGRPIDRSVLCAETLSALAARYGDLLDARFDAILDAWRARAPGSRGFRVTWETSHGVESGITAGIDGTGALLVRVGDRTERLVSGEVIWA